MQAGMNIVRVRLEHRSRGGGMQAGVIILRKLKLSLINPRLWVVGLRAGVINLLSLVIQFC